jgi:hypothetical protein
VALQPRRGQLLQTRHAEARNRERASERRHGIGLEHAKRQLSFGMHHSALNSASDPLDRWFQGLGPVAATADAAQVGAGSFIPHTMYKSHAASSGIWQCDKDTTDFMCRKPLGRSWLRVGNAIVEFQDEHPWTVDVAAIGLFAMDGYQGLRSTGFDFSPTGLRGFFGSTATASLETISPADSPTMGIAGYVNGKEIPVIQGGSGEPADPHAAPEITSYSAKIRAALDIPARGANGDKYTVSLLEVDGQEIWGVSAHGQDVTFRVNAISKTHAEIDALNQLANASPKRGNRGKRNNLRGQSPLSCLRRQRWHPLWC